MVTRVFPAKLLFRQNRPQHTLERKIKENTLMFRFFVPLTILLTFIRVLKNRVLAGRLIIEGTYMKYKYILLIGFLLITGIITSAVANEADWMPDANLRSEV